MNVMDIFIGLGVGVIGIAILHGLDYIFYRNEKQ